MPMVGVGFRLELARWIEAHPPEIECLEVTAEHFYRLADQGRLRRLSLSYPLMVHSLGLSLGTPGPLDHDELERFADIVEEANPLWVSEHLGFRRTPEVDLGHFNPIAPSEETLGLVADHLAAVAERCRKRVLIENITTHLQIRGTLRETEFMNRLCERSGCGLLLDVTNLYVNAHNHGFSPRAWLRDLDAHLIVQLHVAGYSRAHGRWQDYHEEDLQPAIWRLLDEALDYASPEAVIIERDANFPETDRLAAELRGLKTSLDDGVNDPDATA
jgi:uncharacterized protein (UPF0276 family)